MKFGPSESADHYIASRLSVERGVDVEICLSSQESL